MLQFPTHKFINKNNNVNRKSGLFDYLISAPPYPFPLGTAKVGGLPIQKKIITAPGE